MADRRKIRSDREIRRVFLALLQKKGIERITVKEITDGADIGRSTFYLHYHDVYELYETIERETLNDLYVIFCDKRGATAQEVILNRVTASIDYIYDNIELIRLIFSSYGSLHKLQQYCAKYLFADYYLDNKEAYGIIETNFIAWGVVGVLESWVGNDSKIEKTQLADILIKILTGFTASSLSN